MLSRTFDWHGTQDQCLPGALFQPTTRKITATSYLPQIYGVKYTYKNWFYVLIIRSIPAKNPVQGLVRQDFSARLDLRQEIICKPKHVNY